MIASPPIETAVDWPEARGGERRGHLGRHAARARDHADRAGRVGLGGVLGRAADAAHLDDVGDDDPEAVGADDARAAQRRRARPSGRRRARGMRSVTITMSLMPFSIASKTASLVNAGGTVTTEPSIGRAVVLDGLGDGVEHRHAVDLAALAAGRDAADDLRAGAVVEALAREVDGLAAGDALDDEGRLGVDEDAHAARSRSSHGAPRRLVHRHGAVGVLDAVLLEDLEALFLPGARDAEDRDLLGRVVARARGRP